MKKKNAKESDANGNADSKSAEKKESVSFKLDYFIVLVFFLLLIFFKFSVGMKILSLAVFLISFFLYKANVFKEYSFSFLCLGTFLSLLFFDYSISLVLLILIPSFLATFIFKRLPFLMRFALAIPIFSFLLLILQMLSNFNILLSKTMIFLIVVIFPFFVFFVKGRKNFSESFVSGKHIQELFSCLVIVLLIFLVWQNVLSGTNLGRSDATDYAQTIFQVKEQLSDYGKIAFWDEKQAAGFPLLTYNAYLYFLFSGVIAYLFDFSSVTSMNFTYFISMIFFSFSFYCLLRKQNFSFIASILPPILFIANAEIVFLVTFAGYTKTLLPACCIPVLVYCLKEMFDKESSDSSKESSKSSKKEFFYILSLTNAYLILAHLSMGLCVLIFEAIFFIFAFFFKMYDFSFIKKNFLNIMISQSLFLGLVCGWLIPGLLLREYSTFSMGRSSQWLYFFTHNMVSFPSFVDANAGMTPFYAVFFIVSAVLIFMSKKEFLFEKLMIASVFVFSILYWSIKYLQMNLIEVTKYEVLLLFFVCLYMIYFLKSKRILEVKNMKTILLIVLILCSFYIMYAGHERVKNWMSEQILTGQVYKPEMDFLKSLPNGRVITYGLYSTAVDPGVAVVSGKPSIGYSFRQGQHIDFFETKIHDSGIMGMRQDYSGLYQINLLRLVWGKYIWLNVCHPGGQYSAKKLQELTDLRVIYYDNQCMYIIEIPDTGFAEIVSPRVSLINETVIYQKEQGYRYISFENTKEVKGAGFDFENIDENYNVSLIDKPVSLDFRRQNPDNIDILDISMKNNWVHIKEEYYPTWNAYDGSGKKLMIYESNIGTMLVYAKDTTEIVLKNEPLFYMKLLSIISVIALLLFLLI